MDIKKKLDVIIYDKIVESLINGEYKMGQQILLDELVEKFNVSRTPITQAARLLSIDGILEMKTNGRLYVPEFDNQQIRKIVDVRLLIEKYAVELINVNKNRSIIDNLRESAIRFKKCSGDELLKMAKEDLQFHKILVSGAENEYLTDVYRKVQGKYLIASYLVLSNKFRDMQKTAYDHFAFVECLEKNDIDGAKAILEEHINNVCNQMLHH